MSRKDYYAILGIKRDASKAQVCDAYRTLAKQLHPDTNNGVGNPERFNDITEAYSVLSDDGKRSAYDLSFHFSSYDNILNTSRFPGFEFPNANSWFDQKIHFAKRIDRNATAIIGISLANAYCGCKGVVKFDRYVECIACGGAGLASINNTKSICRLCGGSGSKAEPYSAEIVIPPRTVPNSNIVVTNCGNKMANGTCGDLIVRVSCSKNEQGVACLMDGTLTKELVVPWDSALLGEEFSFKLFQECNNDISITLIPSLPDGGQIRLRGLGMRYADLLIKVRYSLPSKLESEDRELIARTIRKSKLEQ